MQQRRLPISIPAPILGIIILLSILVLLPPPTASAHAFVIGSDPVDGSTINTKPKEVHIQFNAGISPLTKAHVYVIRQGQLVDVGSGPARIAPSNTLIIPLLPAEMLEEGSYEVKWSAVADADGHVTHGLIGFNIGFSGVGLPGNAILGPSTSNDLADSHALDLDHFTGILMVFWEWLVLLALTFWIGLQVMERLVLADRGRSLELLAQARARTAMFQWLCPLVLLLGDAVLLFLRTTDQAQIQFQGHFSLPLIGNLIWQTEYGHIWLARTALLVAALAWLGWQHLQKTIPAPPEPAPPHASSETQKPPVVEQPESSTQETVSSQPEAITEETEQKKGTTEEIEQKFITRKLITRDLITRDQELQPSSLSAPTRFEQSVWLILLALLSLLYALTSPVQTLQPHLSAIFFSWLNMIALGLWAGGFAYIALILPPLFKQKEIKFRTETLISLQRRLTPFLLAGIGIFIASAFFLSDASIRDLKQLVVDPYGLSLLVLLGLAGLMIGISIYVLFVLRPHLARQVLLLPVVGPELPAKRTRLIELGQKGRRLKRVSHILTLLGAGVLLCLSLMAYFAPPIVFPAQNYTAAQESTIPTRQTRQLGDLAVTVEVFPGQSTVDNTLMVLLRDKNGQAVTDAQVHLSINMQAMDMGTTQVTLPGDGQPVYATTLPQQQTFNMAGLWLINVSIERNGQPAQQGQFKIMLPT